jgi:hypothetical protein
MLLTDRQQTIRAALVGFVATLVALHQFHLVSPLFVYRAWFLAITNTSHEEKADLLLKKR